MKPLKVNVKILENDRIFDSKGKYYPETKILIVKKGRFSRERIDFICDPSHFCYQIGSRPKQVVFVDMATRTSIDVKTKQTTKWDIANQLDFHTERTFWRALMQSHKLPLSTLLITLFAGMGIYLIIVTFLRVCGFNV